MANHGLDVVLHDAFQFLIAERVPRAAAHLLAHPVRQRIGAVDQRRAPDLHVVLAREFDGAIHAGEIEPALLRLVYSHHAHDEGRIEFARQDALAFGILVPGFRPDSRPNAKADLIRILAEGLAALSFLVFRRGRATCQQTG